MTATSVVATATVIATIMAFTMMIVMIALHIGVKTQIAGQEILNSSICMAEATAVKLNASLGQRHLGTAADATADQNICVQGGQNTGQGAMAAAVGIHNLGGSDLAVLHIIDLKLLGMAKVLENIAVFISDCDSHNRISFRFLILLFNTV